MIHRIAVVSVVTALAALAAVVVSTPAAAAVTSTNITSPLDGTHYLITDASPSGNVAVTGTSNGAPGDSVDIRCYTRIDSWRNITTVAVGSGGAIHATMTTADAYGTCILRAVPHSLPVGSNLAAYTGPRVTTEWNTTAKIATGPNAGKVFDYYILYQSAHALNDYASVAGGGLYDSRLSYPNGTSSNRLWYENAALPNNEDNARSYVRIDGHNAYGPYEARWLISGAGQNNLGFPSLIVHTARNATTGNTTVREITGFAVCPSDTYPPTGVSCPRFNNPGVRLERTIFTNDGGRQVHISDVWRSTDGRAHTISAHYFNEVQGYNYTTSAATPVGLKLPWVSGLYQTFTTDKTFPGPARIPASVFVRDDNTAPNGSTAYPRGAVSFDLAPYSVRRPKYRDFSLNNVIRVPAGGIRLVREAFVMGTTESEVAAKAAANRNQINPYRPDALIKKKGATSFVGNNIYNTTGTRQTVLKKTTRGSAATFYIKVQNDGTTTDTFRVKGAGAKSGFLVKYLAGTTGTTSITWAVEHGTYLLRNLPPGATRTLRLVVKVKAGTSIGTIKSWLVSTWSTHDTSRKDAVKAAVKVIAS